MLANLKRRAHLHAPEAQRPNAHEHACGACSPKCFSPWSVSECNMFSCTCCFQYFRGTKGACLKLNSTSLPWIFGLLQNCCSSCRKFCTQHPGLFAGSNITARWHVLGKLHWQLHENTTLWRTTQVLCPMAQKVQVIWDMFSKWLGFWIMGGRCTHLLNLLFRSQSGHIHSSLLGVEILICTVQNHFSWAWVANHMQYLHRTFACLDHDDHTAYCTYMHICIIIIPHTGDRRGPCA